MFCGPPAASFAGSTAGRKAEAMQTLAMLGLCLVLPVAWGLLVEWVFHRVRRLNHKACPVPPADNSKEFPA